MTGHTKSQLRHSLQPRRTFLNMELENGQIDSWVFCRSIAEYKGLVNDPYSSSAIVLEVVLLSKRSVDNLALAKAPSRLYVLV